MSTPRNGIHNYPITLALSYAPEITSSLEGVEIEGDDPILDLSFGGHSFDDILAMMQEMHATYLQTTERRGSNRIKPNPTRLNVMLHHENVDYHLPWSEFIQSARLDVQEVRLPATAFKKKFAVSSLPRVREVRAQEDDTASSESEIDITSEEEYLPNKKRRRTGAAGAKRISTAASVNNQSPTVKGWPPVRRRRQQIAEIFDSVPPAKPKDEDFISPCHYYGDGECGICFCTSSNKKLVMQYGVPATLSCLPKRENSWEWRLPDDVIVQNPCLVQDHFVCVGCIRTVLLNRDNPPINASSATLTCLSITPGNICRIIPYEINSLKWILTPEEWQYVATLYEQYRFPGFEVVRCPLTIAVSGGRCNAECLISRETIRLQEDSSRLIVFCTQNPLCLGSFCYHCKRRAIFECQACSTYREYNNPESYNRYFYNPNLKGPLDNHLLKNKQITEKIALDQMEEILTLERVTPKCFRCGVHLYKTSMCNGLSHCGVEKCYVCGRNTSVGTHLETSHWDPNGRQGCARYDNAPYWAALKPKFLCKEKICYGDEKDCTIPDHQPGIKAMHDERRTQHIWAMLRSLSREIREVVFDKLMKNTNQGDTSRMKLLMRIKDSMLKAMAATDSS